MPAFLAPIVRLLLATAWLAGALVIAVGSAGVVAAISHVPGSPEREELTWAADELVRPGLAAAVANLEVLAVEVDGLGRAGRGALAALAARDTVAVAAAVEDGNLRVRKIDALGAALREKLVSLPGVGPGAEGRLGWGVRLEYARIGETVALTSDLRAQWAVLTTGSAAAERLTTLLALHDDYVARAVRDGNERLYSRAVVSIKRASVRLDAAVQLRDVLANSADVSTLDEWIARNRAIDTALLELYEALVASKGKSTSTVKRLLGAVERAREQLPPDTSALVVVMADLSRGGLNQAVIEIERVNRGIADAIRAIREIRAGATDGTGSGG